MTVSLKKDMKGFDRFKKYLDSDKLLSDITFAGATVGAINAKAGIQNQRPEWPPLSPETIESKGHDKILWLTGEMHDSLHAERRGANAIYGSDKEYAPNHEFGIGTPKRAFLEPTIHGEELEVMFQAMDAVLAQTIKDANG